MTDLFSQQGINFQSSSMASTHPTVTPAPIEAPKVDMENAPANATPVTPGQNSGNTSPDDRDYLTQLTDPQPASKSLAGAGSEGSAAAGVAPPQPPANSVDLFEQQGIQAPSVSESNATAFNAGVTIPAATPDAGTHAPEMTGALPAQDTLSGIAHGQPAVDPVGYVQNQQAKDKQLAQVVFSQQELDTFKNNPIGFTEAFSKVNRFGYALGDNDADALKILPLANKFNSGQALTPDEQGTVTQYLKDKLEMNLRGFTWAGKTAYVGAQIPSWVAQFALSGGVGKLAETAVQEAGIVAAEQTAKSAAVRLATQYTTMMVPQYQAKFAEQQLSNISAVTDKGQLVLKDAETSPAKTAAMAFGHASADIVAQMMAPAIGKYAVAPITGALATPIVTAASKLSPATTEALYTAWKAVEPSATVSKMFTSAGWHGMIEQLGVNRVQQVLNASVDYAGKPHETFDQYLDAMTPSKDQLLLEGGLISIAGGVHASTSLAFNLMVGKGVPAPEAQNAVDNMSSLEKEQFVNKNLPIPESPTPSIDDTRGKGQQYHGTSRPIEKLSNDSVYSSLNYYGQGLYTTDALDIAQGYSKKGRGGSPSIYEVNAPSAQRAGLFDMEKPLDEPTLAKIKLPEEMQTAIEDLRDSGVKSPNLRQVYDETRDAMTADGNSADTIQEVYDGARESLQRAGYTGLQHTGGLRTNKAPHNVEIYWNAEESALSPVIHADQGAEAAKNIITGGTKEANAANPALIPDKNSGFNSAFKTAKGYAEMWNDLQPIEDLGKLAKERGAPISATELSPASLSLAKSTPALIERQWTTGTTSWDNEGNQVVTGKGLKQIGDDFDNVMYKYEPNMEAREKDMRDFRKAMTFIEDKTKDYNPVSAKDFKESQETMSRLADKYGDQMKWFETFAKEYRDFDNRILHNLVTSNLKTQAWYDDLVGKREWYSSTARVIEAEYPEDVAAMKGKGIGATVNPSTIGALKQRKGSDLEVIDPVLSSMRNSAIIIRRAMLNKVRVDVAKYAEYFPEKVKVKPPAIIRQAVDHSYDPKLRTKLEQLVEFLGGQVKRVKQGDVVGDKKSNLGAYEPAAKTIHMRDGSTEGTLTHEAGHMLDYVLGLKERLLGDKDMKAELQKLSEDRLRSEIKLQQTPEGKTEFAEKFERNPKKYVEYVKNDREVLANFFDAWVNSPEQAKAKAPKATAAFEKLIDENPQLSLLRELAPSTQRATEVIQKELLDFKGPKDSLPFYQNGRLMFLHMDEDTARAFKGLDQVQSTMVGGFIAKVGKAQAKLLQFGATNNPYFIVRHFLRGAQSSYVNTPEGGAAGFFRHFAVEIPKGIAAVIGKNDAYREWASSSGALRTHMDTSTEGMAKLHAEMFDHMDYSKFLNPLNWAAMAKDGFVKGWTTAKQVSDYAPRIAAYARLKGKGYSDLEAGFLSLEATGNYIRHGSLGKEINAYSPFFNDRLQGADRFLRAVKRDPAGYSMRAMALITMPQLLISGYYLFAADDETRKEYLNLSDFRRSAAMNIKVNGQWIPIPRAFAPGFVFGALPEFAMIHYSGVAHPELKNFWLHMIGETVNSLSPSTDWTQTIPPLIKSAIEAKANFSFYRNMPLFHGDINKTAPENQFNSSTSESAKALGKLFGISPVDIDNTSYDMAAHIGVYAQQLGDYAINTQRRLSGQPVNERPTKGSDNPIWGPLMQPAPVGDKSQSFQEFREHTQDLSQQHNRDKEATGKDKAEFERDNHQDLALYPTINRANTEVMHEEHQIRLITENPHFSGDDKAKMIAQHEQKIQIIVEGANNVYRQVKGQK